MKRDLETLFGTFIRNICYGTDILGYYWEVICSSSNVYETNLHAYMSSNKNDFKK